MAGTEVNSETEGWHRDRQRGHKSAWRKQGAVERRLDPEFREERLGTGQFDGKP